MSNHFAFYRALGVSFLYHFASVVNIGDVSRDKLYTTHKSIIDEMPTGDGGCIWEIGAHNGVWESNSYYLIRERGFSAWLFEPSPEAFIKLKKLYGHIRTGTLRRGAIKQPKRRRIHLFNMALSNSTHISEYQEFPTGLENALQVFDRHNQYDKSIYKYNVVAHHAGVLCEQQKVALQRGDCAVEGSKTREVNEDISSFTILSIDTEGADTRILEAAHSTGCTWDMLIVESLYLTPSDMRSLGYRNVCKVGFNHVFARDSHYRVDTNSSTPSIAFMSVLKDIMRSNKAMDQ
jgi:hypothetical protein